MTIHVSDHAFARHVERVMGLDIEAMKLEIIAPILHLIPPLPDKGTTRIIHDGLCYIFKGKSLATVYHKSKLTHHYEHQ